MRANLFAWCKGAAFVALLSVPLTGATEEAKLWKDGPTAYQNTCFYCHDEGQVGPELKGRNLPEAYITAIARSGLKAMPAFPQSHIDDESLALVAKYISEAPATDAAQADTATTKK